MVTQYLPVSEMRERVAAFVARAVPGAPSPADPQVLQIMQDLTAPDASAWAVVSEGQIRAVFGAQLRRPTPADPEYTYMPAQYALASMSMWHVAREDWRYAPGVMDHIARDAAKAGIDRLSIEIPLECARGVEVLLGEGFVPDVILAGRAPRPGALQAPAGVQIRLAQEADADALVSLTLEEADYHAEHTNSGIRANQDPGPSREFVRRWLASQHSENLPTFVAQTEEGVVGMLPLMHIGEGEDHRLPPSYGYVASTCVTARARGRGVGTALVEHALSAAHERGMKVLLLHYVADNPLAAPFWEGFGFEPLTVTLTRVGLNGTGEGEGNRGEHGAITNGR